MHRAVTLLLLTAATADSLPNGYVWGCYNVSKDFPFCNHNLNLNARLDDLLDRLSLDEMISFMTPHKGNRVNTCNFMDKGVHRLGIPPYMHLVEFNTAVASSCYTQWQCATPFPGPTGLGASFNKSLWHMKGAALSDEFRAFNNLNWHRATTPTPYSLIGLTGYGPNINLIRDPRWGRNSEVPSEDPLLAGTYAKHYLRGGQVGADPRYTKVAMGLKHFAAYSVETNRPSFIPEISQHDLWETFLPAYRLGFEPQHGNASAAMCSYAGANGVPSCANDYLLNKVVRGNFSNPDVVVGSDCGALGNLMLHNHYAKDELQVARAALYGGTDQELGDDILGRLADGGGGGLEKLVLIDPAAKGKIKESVRRTLKLRFKTGMFDPAEDQPYTRIGAEAINSTSHQQLNLEAARQTFVLLKNVNKVLPIKPGTSLALVGPHIDSQRDLMSDYKGDDTCFGGGTACVPTVGRIFEQTYDGPIYTAKGCDMNSTNASMLGEAVAAAQKADVTILFLGIGNAQEHEAADRMEVGLPGLQPQLFEEVSKLGKPTVVVLVNGGQVSIGSVKEEASAVVEAFYPSVRGAEALFDVLVRGVNDFGKMPYTVMPEADVYKLQLKNFNMSLAPGRTYKYYEGAPEWEFGYGLSYTEFTLKCATEGTATTVTVTNVGDVGGAEVVLAYHRVSGAIRVAAQHPVPKRELVDFERTVLAPSGSVGLRFEIPQSAFNLVDENGDPRLYHGVHYIDFTNGVHTCTATYNL